MSKKIRKTIVEVDNQENISLTDDEKILDDTLKLIGILILWSILLIMVFAWIVDYNRVRDDKKPMYCITSKVHRFDDGSVEECIGLGYKVYNYNRLSLTKGMRFTPFFRKMK